MKFSEMKVGDILKFSYKKGILKPIIFVLSDIIYMAHCEGKLHSMEINGYRLFKSSKQKFSLNQITPQDVHRDLYDTPNGIIEKIEKKLLPLYINEPKTIWFDRALNGTMKGSGGDIYAHLKHIVKTNPLS